MSSDADLGLRLETFVTRLVETGRYASRSEVLQDGVRLIEEREERAQALDAAITRGIADAEAGRVHPIRDVGNRLVAKYGAADRATASPKRK